EAEQSLDKAFALNPNYAFGHMLRGMFRQQEGEIIGALTLFRRAADAYGPEAPDQVAYLNELIGDIELRLNRPVAAHAALRRPVPPCPNTPDWRRAFKTLSGKASRLPQVARKEYTFLAPATATAEWSQTLSTAASGRLADARTAFQQWTEKHPDNPAGWFD